MVTRGYKAAMATRPPTCKTNQSEICKGKYDNFPHFMYYSQYWGLYVIKMKGVVFRMNKVKFRYNEDVCCG